MLEFFIKKMKNNKGFTLVELIVVIAILGILTAIAVPRLGGFTDTAKEQADKVTASTIENAVALALANGDIEVNDGEDGIITYTKDTNKYTGSELKTPSTDTGLDTLMVKLVGTVSLENATSIEVTINKDEVKAVVKK